MEKRPIEADLEIDTFEDRRDRGPLSRPFSGSLSNPTHQQPFPRPDG